MKRVVSFFLLTALLIFVSHSALAEFSLRSGYSWGMSKDEVMALAEAEGLTLEYASEEKPSKSDIHVRYTDVPFEEYMTDHMTFFLAKQADNKYLLYRYAYFFPGQKTGSPEAEALQNNLYNTLVSMYGEPTETRSAKEINAWYWLLDETKVSFRAIEWPVSSATECSVAYDTLEDLETIRQMKEGILPTTATVSLSVGSYDCPAHIPAGEYKVTPQKSGGLTVFRGDRLVVNEVLYPDKGDEIGRLVLQEGDTLEIIGGGKFDFVPF